MHNLVVIFTNSMQDVLKCIPGITERNYRRVMGATENLVGLSTMGQHDIVGLIGVEAAKKVYQFFNKSI